MTLEQLSAAATQGAWKSILYDAGDRDYYDHNGPTPGIFCDEADCGIVHWDGFKQKYWSSANGNQSQIEANAAFIVALVNLYRTGQLVAVSDQCPSPEGCGYCKEHGCPRAVAVADDAVERVTVVIRDAMMSNDYPVREWETDLAKAAIAAMKDTQP